MRVRRIQGLTGTPATYADSTRVANFARAAQDFYNNPASGYVNTESMPPQEYTDYYSGTKDWDEFVDSLVESVRDQNKMVGTNYVNVSDVVNNIKTLFGNDVDKYDFMRMANDPNQVIPTDLLRGSSNIMFNPNAPDPVFDRRILPESIDTYEYTDPLVGYGSQDITDIPRYDRIMVTPWQDLTDDEKKERVDKAIRTGNTGGIPVSAMTDVKNVRTQTTLSTPGNFEMPSLPPRRIPVEAIEARELAPIRVIKSTNREPQTIYQADPTVNTGQYPIGEYIYNPDKRRWQTDMWDEDMIRASRELALPRRENWRNIEIPPGGFKYGGKFKVKKNC